MYDYLIIGNGIAGLSATEEIRKKDTDAKILIVSAEKPSTYWRTRLSDLISKDFEQEEIFVKKEPWYSEKHIDERLSTKVSKLDLDEHLAILDTGEEISYKKALIATGARPFIPPIKNIDAKGVFAIRTVSDLRDFKDFVKDKKKVVVIGGGILGLEAAYSATKIDLDVTVIESFSYLLSKQLDQDLSKRLENELNKLNIKTITGKTTEEVLVEDGLVKAIKLSDGSIIEADAIMVQTGIKPNISVAEKSGLETDKAILVDENLKTKNPDVFVAGDCAQIGDMTIGLWTSSQEMGKIAGNNMTGESKTYQKPKPFSSLNIEDIKIFSAGVNSADGIEEIRVDKEDKTYKLFKKDDKYVGAIIWGDMKLQNDAKDIVFDGKNLEDTKLGREIFNK